ncbi:glycosyltransferase family A protein [Sphaerisporangium sp. B11E5]|uniref:glycosyltransferase n=1 Tax=Sphaerisporangium sp. B11E5 TaxID=3153563 RepID=UPI00325EE82B
MTEAPKHVQGLAEQRAAARADHDDAIADVLTRQIEDAGWTVRDTGDGYELAPRPPFTVWPAVSAVQAHDGTGDDREDGVELRTQAPTRGTRPEERVAGRTEEHVGTESMIASQVLWDSTLATSRLDEAITAAAEAQRHDEVPASAVTVALVVDGHPSDLRKCVDSLISYTQDRIIALDLGDMDGAGTVLHELAERHPGRITAWHVAETPHWRGGTAGWGAARNKLLELDTGEVHVVMETSTVLDGDAITALVELLRDGVAAAGWKGVNREGDEWREAGPGEVRALRGNLLAVRREAALKAGGFPEEADYYRHADLEFCLRLPGKLVAAEKHLPVHRERHRAYHEADPGYRDRETSRTDERVRRLLASEV